MRAVLVFLFPGANIFSGVSSANRDVPPLARFAMASANGSRSPVDLPTQSAIVSDPDRHPHGHKFATGGKAADDLQTCSPNMRQQAGTRSAPFNRARGHRGLRYRLTATAGHTRSGDFVHHKAARDVFQLFGNIFARREIATALRAILANRQNLLDTFQMIGQRFAPWLFLQLYRFSRRGFCGLPPPLQSLHSRQTMQLIHALADLIRNGAGLPRVADAEASRSSAPVPSPLTLKAR